MYIDKETMEYPIDLVEIQKRNPEWLMPQNLEKYAFVHLAPFPEYSVDTHKLVEDVPKPTTNPQIYQQVWNVVELSSEELEEIRLENERLISESKIIEVSRRQALLALSRMKNIKDTDVYAVIQSIESEELRYEARISWEGAISFVSNSEFVSLIGELLGLTQNDIDSLFAYARTI